MKEIKLTQGKVALVDDKDFDYLNQWKWCAHKVYNTYYAVRNEYNPANHKAILIRMHRVIMNTPKGMETDHIDHNNLNNQRNNLRICTHAQNMRNKKPLNKTSKYLGVHKDLRKLKHGNFKHEKFITQISYNRKRFCLGVFKTEEEAAKCYDNKAKELFGEFANLNFKS